jgi:hypothetical protein
MQIRMAGGLKLRPGPAAEGQQVAQLMDRERGRRH